VRCAYGFCERSFIPKGRATFQAYCSKLCGERDTNGTVVLTDECDRCGRRINHRTTRPDSSSCRTCWKQERKLRDRIRGRNKRRERKLREQGVDVSAAKAEGMIKLALGVLKRTK